MKFEPRYYQREALEALQEYTANNQTKNPVIVLPTGTGKALLQAMIVEWMLSWSHTKILLVTHQKELIAQNSSELISLLNTPFIDYGIYSAGLNKRDNKNRILFGGIQSIYKRAWTDIGFRDIMIVDECFTGETLISTPFGFKEIKNIKKGDKILNAFGVGKVEEVFRKKTNKIYTLRLSNGKKINCTGSHKFFTRRGWIAAQDMEKGESLFCRKKMSYLRDCFLSEDKNERERRDSSPKRNKFSESKILFDILFSEVLESDERPGIKRKNGTNLEKDRPQAYKERRKWERIDEFSKDVTGFFGQWLDSGIVDKNPCWTFKRSLSKLLQGRFRKRKNENGNRIRWKNSLRKTTFKRCEEDGDAEFIRVESISAEKCGSGRTVYDLQVSGHPSYYAEGVLVHNCHLIPHGNDGMYRSFIAEMKKINPKIIIVGLSATPYRLKGGLLTEGKNKLFDDICYEVTIPELINPDHPKNKDKKQYLGNIITPKKSMKSKVDLSNVHVRAGEYVEKEMQDAFCKDDLISRSVKEILEHVRERKKVLIFTAGILHCEKVFETFQEFGQSVDFVHSQRIENENRKALEDFKFGKIKFLINVSILTTGYNVKDIDCIVLMRATKSPGLYVQMVGRGTRLHPSKENCLVLDLAHCIETHGPIDKIEIKKQKDGTSKAEGMPEKCCPNCESMLALAVMICPDCGYEFPQKDKHEDKASEADIISTYKKPETMGVDSVFYSVHKKIGSPDSLRVQYYTGEGLMSYSEYICPMHQGFAQRKAIKWLERRLPVEQLDKPLTCIEDIIDHKHKILQPSHIIIDFNGKFPNIIGHLFIDQEKKHAAV